MLAAFCPWPSTLLVVQSMAVFVFCFCFLFRFVFIILFKEYSLELPPGHPLVSTVVRLAALLCSLGSNCLPSRPQVLRVILL